jgi:transposase, IS5 family
MKGKSPCQGELNLFEPVLRQVTEADHPLRVMADSFPWSDIESGYSVLYSSKGAPAKPVRLMAGLLILKHIFGGTDEGVVNQWARDIYFQYFCGGNLFIRKLPCDPSDLAHFRRRIGNRRMMELLDLSARYQLSAGIDKLSVPGDLKPGQENFSYTGGIGLYQSFLRKITGLTGKFSRMLTGA